MNAGRAPTRVLIVGPLPPPHYGGSIFTAALIEGVSQRAGFETRALDTQGNRALAEVGLASWRKGVAVARQSLAALRLALEFRPRVLYSPIPIALGSFLRYSLFVLLARLVGARSVVQFHDGQFDVVFAGYPRWARAYARFVLGQTAAIVVLGERLVSMLDGIAPRGRVRVVRGSRDDGPFQAARERAAPRRSSDPVRVLFLSHLFRDKGYLDVLRAAAIARRSRQDLRFQFAGDWPSDEEARAAARFVRENDLGGVVEFLGSVTGPKKYDLLASASIFVLPTFYRFEAQPSAVIEALAAGLPVVTTDWAGLPEMVEDGDCGFVVPVADPSALADRIVRLAAEPALRERMGRRARERFLALFTRQRWLDGMCAVLQEAAGLEGPLR